VGRADAQGGRVAALFAAPIPIEEQGADSDVAREQQTTAWRKQPAIEETAGQQADQSPDDSE
jgi:hypothetical protein